MEQKRVKIDAFTGLVLEGGGMRGVFTSGVLDNFMDRGIRFPYVIGVSAGACNGLSYMSGQRGRAKYSNIDLLDKYHYIGLRPLFTQRNLLDFNLLFHEFPEHILPYDYEAYFRSPERYVMVTTNCLTGEANYLEEKADPGRVIDIVKASSSLPFACPIVQVDGIPMLDGGIVDSIPLMHAHSEGCRHNVVVLTRNKGYRKEVKGTTGAAFSLPQVSPAEGGYQPTQRGVQRTVTAGGSFGRGRRGDGDPSAASGGGGPHRKGYPEAYRPLRGRVSVCGCPAV